MNSSLMGGKQSKVIFRQIFDSFEIIDSHEWVTNYTGTTVFDTLTSDCEGSLIEKTAKFASHPRSCTLRFLSGAISQKRTEIVDFTDFYETFWSKCRERNERSP